MRQILSFSTFLFLTCIFFINCNNTPTPVKKDFSKLNWLLGTWELNNGAEYETWSKLNDHSFHGRNFRVYNQHDTVITENIELIFQENEIQYIPTVKTPKGDKRVFYKQTSDSGNHFVFENPEHSFPKKISYIKIDDNTAKSIIEGGKRKLEYDLKRVD